MKDCDIFFIFAQNIDCGTKGVLTSTHDLFFRAKRRKKEYPSIYIKVGCEGCYHDDI